uniref:Uncharacterized protein n=1 Tax=Neobodo designis TaxID=312471 RepID=A0A7S1Q0A8_NEODS|mmetsp:Transcript_281/g.1087  ORF Transcript_281/g.1087 Transcript_281/m.1087 type:complete len:363 (+) Transcript_281:36-1124(+)
MRTNSRKPAAATGMSARAAAARGANPATTRMQVGTETNVPSQHKAGKIAPSAGGIAQVHHRSAEGHARLVQLPADAAVAPLLPRGIFQDVFRCAAQPTTTTKDEVASPPPPAQVTVVVDLAPGNAALRVSASWASVGVDLPARVMRVDMAGATTSAAPDDDGANAGQQLPGPSVLFAANNDAHAQFDAVEIAIARLRQHLHGTPRFALTVAVAPCLPGTLTRHGSTPAAVDVAVPVDLAALRHGAGDGVVGRTIVSVPVPEESARAWLPVPPPGMTLTEGSRATIAAAMRALSTESHNAAARTAANRRAERVLTSPTVREALRGTPGTPGADQVEHLRRAALCIAAASSQSTLATARWDGRE